MKPTNEHFRKLAGEAGFDYAPDGDVYPPDLNTKLNINKEIEALCQRVWNEAIEAAADVAENCDPCSIEELYMHELIRKLKVKP